jgi:hypothetical protein
MELPLHYLHIKNMLNLTLFGETLKENDFKKVDKIQIHPNYVKYHKSFKEQESLMDNDYLKECIKFYLSDLTPDEKYEIIQIIKDNNALCLAISMLYALKNQSDTISDQNNEFENDLIAFKNTEGLTPHFLILFFQQHFLNFDHIDLSRYENYELDRNEYFLLLKDYLQPQTKVF